MHAIRTAQNNQQAHQRWLAGKRAEKSKKWAVAAREYEQAARLAPGDALHWMSLSTARLQLGQPAEALQAARQAYELAPDNAIACKLLAIMLSDQHRHDEAANVLAKMPAEAPRDAEYLIAYSRSLLRAQRWQEAVAPCLELLQKDMFNPVAHLHLGLAMQRLNRPGDAAVCFETAASMDKKGHVRALALSQLVEQLRYAVQWEKLPQHMDALLKALQQSSDEVLSQIISFSLLSIDCPPRQQLRVAQLSSARLTAHIPLLPAPGARVPGPLRIAYLSNDFHDHATALLMVAMLEQHDPQRVKVALYCHSKEDGGVLQRRVRAAAHLFRDVRHLSDAEVAQLMRQDGIDIAIDLKGQTTGTRYQILAHRPAPIQVSFLGYPGTTGASFLDYVLGDPLVTPLAHAGHFSERIAQMPHSYQPNDSRRHLPPKPSRAEVGLPEDALVLCCFNQTYKLSPEVADLWAQILLQAPNTVLWLLIWNTSSAGNLMRELQARGVPPERVFFSPKTSSIENQARLQCADLFLDTWPYNAHTTASEALWGGVPVLTVPGETFASRVAASLLTACELPQLVCDSPQAYVDKAVALARNPEELRAAQRHLVDKRQRLPLFDSVRYTRDFEDLLARMWARHEAGLAPDHLLAEHPTPENAT